MIRALRASFLLLALTVAGLASTATVPAQAIATPAMPAQVLRGSGELTDTALVTVERELASQYRTLLPLFPGLQPRPFVLWLHGSRAALPPQLSRFLHQDAAGFTLLGQRQIHLVWGELQRQRSSPAGVIAHELVHELLDQYTAPQGNLLLPRWFHEGLAQVLAGDTYLGAREEDLLWRVGAERLLAWSDLREGFPSDRVELQTAYAQSYSYVAWLHQRYGLPMLLQIARAVDRDTSLEKALVRATGRTTLELQDAWLDHLRYGSGAFWRLLGEHSFGILLLASLPLFWLAYRRRNARERRAAERLRRIEVVEPAPIDADAAAELQGPPLPPQLGPAPRS